MTTRRTTGSFYTSIENVHRVIDPLFLNELRAELDHCGSDRERLIELQSKLCRLTFLDPACGSGNFLVETFRSLQRLENKIIERLPELSTRVAIDQFFGIEINPDAVSAARSHFPASIAANHIIEGNALRFDWHSIVPTVDFIIGNPPFIGASYQTAEQKADVLSIDKKLRSLDYACAWFKKAADFMIGTQTRTAFVATNSIAQGETVVRLAPLIDAHIDFAWRSLRWSSEHNASVTCVIIGFSHAPNTRPKIIFDGDQKIVATNISPYLIDAPNIVVASRPKPICNAPPMMLGNMPVDDGNLITSADERDELLRREPQSKQFIRRLVGAKEFINGLERYCLWLVDATSEDIRAMPCVMARLDAVRDFRLSSRKAATRRKATKPWLFAELRQPSTNYIIVPRVSSERRRYVPMGFLPPEIIVGDSASFVPDATLYHFGVLESIVHMAWMRTVCGRLEISYRYSAKIVYNNFPWIEPTIDQIQAIEHSARRILDVRSKYEGATLADLYDETTMPDDLRKAHADNDRAVLDAYGFDRASSESEIVTRLMIMYERLTDPLGLM